MKFRTTLLAALLLLSTPVLQAQSMMIRTYNIDEGANEDINRGDFNNDGIPDVVFCSTLLDVGVALGSPDGTLQAPKFSGSVRQCNSLAVGDFNHDGNLDVAVASYVDGVEILLGNGDGTFSTAEVMNVPSAYGIVAGDFNGDGILDLAVVNVTSSVLIFLGNGDGTFQNAISYPTSLMYLNVIRSGDFDNDGRTDLAVGGFLPGVSVLFNNGGMKFQELDVNPAANLVTTADINGDGATDLLLNLFTNCIEGPKNTYCDWAWTTYLSNGAARSFRQTFTQELGVGPFGAISASITDVNGDGINDVVATTGTPDSSVSVWLGKPDGSFNTTRDLYELSGEIEASPMVSLDLNRDGRPDFVVSGPGTFQMGIITFLNAYPRAACATYTASASVTGCQPANAVYLTSPVSFVANSYSPVHPVTAMQIYADNALKYTTPGNKLNTTLPLGNGSHIVATKAWDSSGASFLTLRDIAVYSGTPAPVCSTTLGQANICLPAPGTTTTSPVQVFAAGYNVALSTSVQLYIDNVLVYSDDSGANYMNASFPLSPGNHLLYFKVWDANGNTVQTSRTITVQ